MNLPLIDETIRDKKVFVRGDIDVPVSRRAGEQESRIEDDTRLKDILPTIEFLLKQNCTVLLAGHLGRPEGKEDMGLSSKPVAEWMAEKLQTKVSVSGVCLKGNICGFIVTEKLIVLENLRFDPREEANDETYAKELASLAEVYVNEAFATCEREHASIIGVPKFLPHFAGFRLAKEVEVLSGVLENPKRPLVVIIGGAKIETKQPVIAKMQDFADSVLVGGKLTGKEENDMLESEMTGWSEKIAAAGTILWNGPVGKIEEISFQVGTKRLAELIAGSSAYKIVGGGDTVAFLDKLGLTSKFDWVSSGGGSMLKFLSGEKLPGVEALVAV